MQDTSIVRCPGCGEAWPGSMRFCGMCGRPLHTLKEEEERKIATVLFVDLVGFTKMAERMDVEDVEAFLDRYFAAVNRVVRCYEGYVNKLVGDAALVVFGAPRAVEDHAYRAVRAALDLRTWAQEQSVALHLGIHTGEILLTLMGTGQARDYTIIGDTVNLAQRIQSLTRPNEILVSGVTRALVEEYVDLEFAGKVRVKNRERPVDLWRVLGERPPDRGRPSWLPFVGRVSEIQMLRHTLLRTKRSALVVISGDVGVGKSRLVREALASTPVLILRSLPDRTPYSLLRGDPEGTFVLAWIEEHPEGVLWLEDFQWADLPSVQVIAALVTHESRPFRVVVTTREIGDLFHILQRAFDLRGGEIHQITLQPLSDSEVETLLYQLGMPPSVQDRIRMRSQGIPLLIEAMYDLYREGRLSSVPEGVEGLFAAQIDRLPVREKDALRRLSILGSVFPKNSVAGVGLYPDAPEIRALIHRGFLQEERDVFRFRHPLLRDTAWRTLLIRQRKALHREALEALERQHASPHILAQHALGAEVWDKAESYGLQGVRELLEAGDFRSALELAHSVRIATQRTGNDLAQVRLDLYQAHALFRLGDRDQALRILETLEHRHLPPSLRQEHALLMARVLSVSGERTQALQILERLPSPPSPPVLLTRAQILSEQGKVEEAHKILEHLTTRRGPLDPSLQEDVYIERMRLFVLQMDFRGFHQWVREVFPPQPGPRLEAYLAHWMAVARREEGKMEEARRLHQRALKIARDRGLWESWPLFLLEYARTLRRSGHMDEADLMLSRTLMLTTHHQQDPVVRMKAWVEKGFLHIERGKVDEGIQILQKVLPEAQQTDPFTAVGILHNLGVVALLIRGNLTEAQKYLCACLDLTNPQEDPTTFHLSHLLLYVARRVENQRESLPPATWTWIQSLPSVMAQTILAWTAQVSLPHALPFPQPMTLRTWEQFLIDLIQNRRERLLRLALWRASQSSPFPFTVLVKIYEDVLQRLGVPAVYRRDIPFRIIRPFPPERSTSTNTTPG